MMILRIKDEKGRVILEMRMMPGYEVSISFSDKDVKSSVIEENDKTVIDLEEKKKELMKVKPQTIPDEKYEAERESVESVKEFRSQVEEEIASELENLLDSTGEEGYAGSRTSREEVEESGAGEPSTEIVDDLLRDTPPEQGIMEGIAEEQGEERNVKKEDRAKEILSEILDFQY